MARAVLPAQRPEEGRQRWARVPVPSAELRTAAMRAVIRRAAGLASAAAAMSAVAVAMPEAAATEVITRSRTQLLNDSHSLAFAGIGDANYEVGNAQL